MKRAVVLHGYKSNPYVNWYPWLAWRLRKRGYKTWSPWLPKSSLPDGNAWNQKLLSRKSWDFKDSLIIGHSAGSVEILNLLSILPQDQKPKTVVLVSSLRLKPNWPALRNLIPEPFDFQAIKKNAGRFIFVHAVDDPTCPIADSQYYADKLGGELIILPSGGHFNILRDVRFWRFPKLLEALEERKVL